MKGPLVGLVVTGLIEKNGKYLIVQRSEKNITNKNKWQFPEGKVRPGENLLKALRREVEEETNLVVVNIKLLGIHSNISKETHGVFRILRTIFKCKTRGKLKLSKEHKDFKWVHPREFYKIDFINGFDPKNIISVKRRLKKI